MPHGLRQNKEDAVNSTNLVNDKYFTRVGFNKFFVHQVQYTTWRSDNHVNCQPHTCRSLIKDALKFLVYKSQKLMTSVTMANHQNFIHYCTCSDKCDFNRASTVHNNKITTLSQHN